MITEVITFWGIVQGVGFRPTLSRIAAKYRMRGQVRNMGAFVQLIVTDEPGRIDAFIEAVQAGKPRMADIMRIDRKVIETTLFDDFRIVSSAAAEDEIVAVPADVSVCDECLAEFRNPSDPRHAHPFISCVDCGPRYSIMESLPYDRETTTMSDFPMCSLCSGEYTDPASRRYHAQTVSCHDCGPRVLWRTAKGMSCDNAVSRQNGDGSVLSLEGKEGRVCGAAAVSEAIAAIRGGDVIALKGVGGYYFVCSPFDETAVRNLREIKVREHKPFAIMFASVKDVRAYCVMSDEEESLLSSPKRPIVLLERATGHEAAAFAPGVMSTSRFIGAFLPSMTLQYMLTDALGPLVMTSANISDLPIVKDDAEMFAAAERDGRIAGVLYNERRIVRRLDDSVARVMDGALQLIRRSKGWTPVPIYVRGVDRLSAKDQIFAAGADLKSAFALTKGSFVHMSQHIGDMDNLETERAYVENLESMRAFFGVAPSVAAFDTHPLYRTAEIARRRAGLEPMPVQHHHAHVASVMAEHGLTGPVIGVAFDGTGYGADGTIWGGEILICEGAEFERFSHLRDIAMIGGDASMRDGWKSAICRMADARGGQAGGAGCASADEADDGAGEGGYGAGEVGRAPADGTGCGADEGGYGADEVSRARTGSARNGRGDFFDIDISYAIEYALKHGALRDYEGDRGAIEAAVAKGVNTVRTSSMGRLFDAVASLLGIHHVNRYEGECAVMLENAAHRALVSEGAREPDALALRFHRDVARAVLGECRWARAARGIDTVCLSGGVFQNRILMEETLRLLRGDGFTPLYNIAVPPNDGGIALGQAYVAMRSLLSRKR